MEPIVLRAAMPNGLLFVSDYKTSLVEVPEVGRTGFLWATSTCLVIGCEHQDFGETEITFGLARDVGLAKGLIFDGAIKLFTEHLVLGAGRRRDLSGDPYSARGGPYPRVD